MVRRKPSRSVHFAELVNLPWGGPDGMIEAFVETPHVSIMTDRRSRLMRAPLRVRVNPWGWIDVCASAPISAQGTRADHIWLYRFSPTGALVHSMQLPAPSPDAREWHNVDLLTDEAGSIYLLDSFNDDKGQQNSLRKIAPDGRVIWSRTGSHSIEKFDVGQLRGQYRQLLGDARSGVYLAATQHRGLVARIDPANGELTTYADWGEYTGEVFMDGKAQIYYVRFVPKIGTRCWCGYDPASRLETITSCDRALYALLAMPIATDNQGQGYAVAGGCISCIGRDGSLQWQEHLENLVIDPKIDAILISTYSDGTVNVRIWEKADGLKQELKLALPSALAQEIGDWELAHVDAAGKYFLYGGEIAEKDGTQLVYSPLGELEGQMTPAPEMHRNEYRLQAGRTWAVDLQGGIYLPVLGPRSFHVVRMVHV
jgi:hypothetical protein